MAKITAKKALLFPCPLILALFLLSFGHSRAQQGVPSGGYNQASSGGTSLNVTSQAIISLPLSGSAATNCSTGLMAWYRFLPGDSAATPTDSSGCGNAGTGSVGTPCTVGASPTGGLVCVGAGAFKTPAALNAAVTWVFLVSFQPNSATTGNQALVIGNGNGGTAGTSGLLLTTSNAGSDPIVNNFRPWSLKAGANNQCGFQLVAGITDVEWAMGTAGSSGGDNIAINGQIQQTANLCGGNDTGAQTTGVFQVGGAAAGSGFASISYFTGTIIEAAAYGTSLNSAQIAQVHNFMQGDALVRGFTVSDYPGFSTSPYPNDQKDTLVFVGDSLTAGNGFQPFPLIYTATNAFTNTVSSARSSSQCAPILADYNILALPAYRPGASRNVLINWCGTNSSGSFTAQQVFGYANQFGKLSLATGFQYLDGDMISRTGFDTQKNTINAQYRQLSGANGFALVDWASDPNLGADGASTNTTFFQVDGVHPTSQASYNDLTPMFNVSLNRLTGHRDFSTATTYASAPSGAIALSAAATESTNTMSFTSAGWTAGQFVPGTRMHCTGISVSGYNDVYPGWLILTNSGTVITAYNGTTGLGNSTVAGSCIGTIQQDADEYTILNVGAVNFTIESCLGLGGLNQREYFMNINSGTTTLAPWDGETITGGATVVQNATATLEAELTSASAAGCFWRRIQ